MARRRARWRQYQDRIDPARLVFIDETWTKTNMALLRGWAPKGQRLLARAPFGHWNTMTFVAALRRDRIEAPWLLDGTMNGESFGDYVQQVLVPTLRPGDLVIMDNPQQSQGAGRAPLHPPGLRQAIPSAEIFARSKPDRAGLRQAKTPAAQGCRTKPGRGVRYHRHTAQHLYANRMCQLLRPLRVCAKVNTSRSSMAEVAHGLNRRGVLTPRGSGSWTHTTVSRVLGRAS